MTNPKIMPPDEVERIEGDLPVLAPLPDRGLYVLLGDWHFAVDGTWFAIPSGYTFDGASIPRFFWRVCTPFGPGVMPAALEHDWLCDLRPPMVSSRRAAEHFRDRLQVHDALREAMYRAVLLGGPQWGDEEA